jgi:glucosamine--fructose-6-phosphate aminotransferase (isomerizing)
MKMTANPYISDLLGQPAALQDTLAGLAQAPDLQPFARRLASGDFKRVVLTGMGSSYHALHPLWLSLVAKGVPAYQIETSELIHSAPALLDERALVVAVSQSGRSAEILRLLEMPHGVLLGVTNTPDSPLAQQAGAVILTQAGEESTVSCKTYITALAALAILGQTMLGGDLQALFGELSSIPSAMARYLENWQASTGELLECLAGVQSLILAGRGASLAAVGTGALIIKEAAHFPAEGMSSAALRHGPLNMASPGVFVLVFEGTGAASPLNGSLVQELLAAGGKAALVRLGEGEGAFTLPFASSAGLPMLEILPAQMLSLACAQLTGWRAGEFGHTGKVTERE